MKREHVSSWLVGVVISFTTSQKKEEEEVEEEADNEELNGGIVQLSSLLSTQMIEKNSSETESL